MNIGIISTFILYVITVLVITGRLFFSLLHRREEEVSQRRVSYQSALQKADEKRQELKMVEEQTRQIFTLFDMMKEITKNFNEADALRVFEKNLRRNISYSDCRLLEPLSEEAKHCSLEKNCLLFTLMGQKELLGYLSVRGMAKKDEEIFAILAHQFALALRRIRLYQKVEHLAIIDSLTDVHTRRYVLERFEEEVRRAQVRQGRLSFLMLDVDFFKTFNDQYGHLVGDQILREISKIIRDNIREIDIVGRLGGEEFCVILPDTDRAGAQYAAERIRGAVERNKIKAYDMAIQTTISIGCTTFPEDGKTSEELLEKSDGAMYQAKKSGRNLVRSFSKESSPE